MTEDELHREAVRLIQETPGAQNLNDVLRIRGADVFSPDLLAKLGPIVHEHDGKVVPGPDHDEPRMMYPKERP